MTSQDEVYRWLINWEKALPLERPLLDPDRVCELLTPRLPPPPGEVVERFEGTQCYADGAAYFQYVLVEDGSLWEWNFIASPFMLSLYPLLGIAGCIAGALLAGLLVILTMVLASSRTQPDSGKTL